MPDPIQDFIVRLRFSVDSGQQRHFDDMIKRSHDSLGKLNLDLIGAITAIGVAIEKSSKQLRDFGITAQVTGTASGQIDDLAAAFRTMGRSTADAQNQIQSLFSTITQNPGIRNFLQAQGYRGDPTNLVAMREFILDYLFKRFPGGPGSRGQIRRDQFAEAYFKMSAFDVERGGAQLPMEREQRALQERRRRDLGLEQPQMDVTTGLQMTDATGKKMTRYDYLTTVQANRIQKDIANLGTEFELFAVILQDKWGDRFAHFLELITGGLHEFNVLMASSSPWASGLAAVGLALTGVIGSLALLRIALFGLRFSIAPLLALLRLVPGAAAGGAAAGAAGAAAAAAAAGTAGRVEPTLAGTPGLRAGSRVPLSKVPRVGIGGATGLLGLLSGPLAIGTILETLFHGGEEMSPEESLEFFTGKKAPPKAANTNVGSLMGLTQALERSGVNARSGKGAIGRNQMMPATAKALAAQSGMPYDESMLYDPAYNDKLAGLLLQQLMAKYHGNLQKVLIDYNAGPVREKMWERMGDAGLKQETVNYYHRGMGLVGRDPNLARGLQKQGVDITQNNYYTIHGGGDAERAAAGVGQQQNRTNANLTRQVQQVAH